MLDRRYKDVQRLIHPDKFHNKSEVEQAHSSAFASHLASANKTLKEPLSRAQYLVCAPRFYIGSRVHYLNLHENLLMTAYLFDFHVISFARWVSASVKRETLAPIRHF
jgi:hypothetical protein